MSCTKAQLGGGGPSEAIQFNDFVEMQKMLKTASKMLFLAQVMTCQNCDLLEKV